MQVILTKPVRKLGKVGDIVQVKNGYGKNYLLPNQIAIRASKDNIKDIESQKDVLEHKNSELKVEAETSSQKVMGKNLIFISQAAADGRLFGSVSAKVIASKLTELTSYPLDYSNILLDNPIKYSGFFKVDIAYHPEVIGSVNVVVARSESEAQDMIVEAQNAKSDKETSQDDSAKDDSTNDSKGDEAELA